MASQNWSGRTWVSYRALILTPLNMYEMNWKSTCTPDLLSWPPCLTLLKFLWLTEHKSPQPLLNLVKPSHKSEGYYNCKFEKGSSHNTCVWLLGVHILLAMWWTLGAVSGTVNKPAEDLKLQKCRSLNRQSAGTQSSSLSRKENVNTASICNTVVLCTALTWRLCESHRQICWGYVKAPEQNYINDM